MARIKSSRLIGPEDVKRGQYVTVAEVMTQYVYMSGDPCTAEDPRPRVATVSLTPGVAGWPFRVERVSLPYVLVVAPDGERHPIDLRRHRLARLRKSYGRAAFRLHEAAKAEAANAETTAPIAS